MVRTVVFRLALAITVVVCWGMPSVAAAPAPGGANVAQVELSSPVVCPQNPPGTQPQFMDIPDLSVAVTTNGGPVWMSLTLSLTGQSTSELKFDPVIDGTPHAADRLMIHVYEEAVLVFTKLYPLPAGLHTFSGRVSCFEATNIDRGWLTVYELPPATKSK